MRNLKSSCALLALALAGCAPVGVPAQGATPAGAPAVGGVAALPLPRGRADEVRALWVVRTSLTSPAKARAMVEEASRSGFNTLIVQVRGRGDSFWRSDVEPRSEALWDQPADFDPLALVVGEAHARGLRVHAWVNTFLVWDTQGFPVDSTHFVRTHPELLAVPRALVDTLSGVSPGDPRYVEALLAHAAANSTLVEGLYSSPSSPEVHDRILRIWMELAQRYPLDGIHFDYVRYPNVDYDYSTGALRAFREWARPRVRAARAAELDSLAAADPVAWTVALPEEWAEFRKGSVTSLVRRVSREVKRARPGLIVSAAVFPDADEASLQRFQSWSEWVDDRLLDVVAPMAYTPEDEVFRGQIDAAVREVGRNRVWAGIGAYQNSFEGTLSKIGIARELRTAGFSLFSYDWAAEQRADGGGSTYLEGVRRRAFEAPPR